MTAPPSIQIFTYREGLLSRFGHDLRMHVGRFDIAVDDGKVTAKVELESLRVDGAVEHGKLKFGVLSDGDRDKIRHTALSEVLEANRHPEVRLEGKLDERAGTVRLEGELTLGGRKRALPPTVVRRQGDRIRVSLDLTPSRWGIRPYRAMAGALRVQDHVLVEVDLPDAPEVTPQAGQHRWKA